MVSLCTNEQIQTQPTRQSVFEHYSPSVYRLALAILANRADAEDIAQEVFVRYLEKPPVCESEEHRRRWLLKVTVNLCRSLRRNVWNKTLPLSDMHPCYDPEPDDGSVLNAVLALPLPYRTVIHLFYYEDLSVFSISALIGLSEAGVKTRLNRAREMLKPQLKGVAFDVS